MPSKGTVSLVAVLVAILAVLAMVLAGALFLSTNDAGTQRLASLLALAALILPVLIGMLRGDLAAQRLDSNLDERVRAAVLAANYTRRTSDVTPESAAPVGRESPADAAILAPADLGTPGPSS